MQSISSQQTTDSQRLIDFDDFYCERLPYYNQLFFVCSVGGVAVAGFKSGTALAGVLAATLHESGHLADDVCV